MVTPISTSQMMHVLSPEDVRIDSCTTTDQKTRGKKEHTYERTPEASHASATHLYYFNPFVNHKAVQTASQKKTKKAFSQKGLTVGSTINSFIFSYGVLNMLTVMMVKARLLYQYCLSTKQMKPCVWTDGRSLRCSRL